MNNMKIKRKAIDWGTVGRKDDKLKAGFSFPGPHVARVAQVFSRQSTAPRPLSRQVVGNLNEFTHHLVILYSEASPAVELGRGLRSALLPAPRDLCCCCCP